MTRWILTISLLGVGFYDFLAYRAADPATWQDVLHGTAPAPQQYRVAIVDFAFFLAQHLHISIATCFAGIDTISALAAGFVLLHLLEESPIYRKSSTESQYFANAAFLFLLLFYLLWLFPQRAETLPSTLYVALTMWLWLRRTTSAAKNIVVAIALLALGFLQSWIRADVVCLLSFGGLMTTLGSPERRLVWKRWLAGATSLTTMIAAYLTQAYLSKVLYPEASYGRVKLWQLRPNLIHATRWPPFLIFMTPVAWALLQIVRRRYKVNTAELALIVGSLGYFVIWMCFGKADEMRIFIPFAIALMPLTIQLLLARVASVKANQVED